MSSQGAKITSGSSAPSLRLNGRRGLTQGTRKILTLSVLLFQIVAGRTADLPREIWTGSQVRGTPEPPPPILVERVFPQAQFKEPVDLGSSPAGPQLYILEVGGKLFFLDPREAQARPELLIDLRQGHPGFNQSYGFTFHPGVATNGWMYVSYVVGEGKPDGSRVSRFTLESTNPPRVKPGSEQIVITWLGGGHNGGCLKFGADGMLYISTGDSASPSPPDPLTTGQDISDLMASILRIDVDHPNGALPYSIPASNPFLKTPRARGEVWAYGLRNPWKISFEPGTSVLWVGDVGWELWEMIFRLDHAGVNCGWSVMESRQAVRRNQALGPTPIQKPITDHGHEEAASITGGMFYRGKRAPNLRGAYVYGDWETGKMWSLRHEGDVATSREEIARTPLKIVGFGESSDQELYLLDHAGGGIYGLTPNPRANKPEPFPRRLSETGLFASTKTQTPAPGVYAFEPNAPLWTDGAEIQRWVGIPSTGAVRYVGTFWQAPRDLTPSNAVWARTVSLRTDRARPETKRKIETQLLHYDGLNWGAYTYRWNEDQSDATLVGSIGAEETFVVRDSSAPGFEEPIRWRFHSGSECLRCHNPWNGTLLGFQPAQLTRKPEAADELTRLKKLGLIDHPTSSSAITVNPHDSQQPLELRARSYLHANCGHCHREGAGGSVLLKLNIQMASADMHLLDAPPVQGTLGVENARLVSPGDPLRSVMLYRFAKTGAGHMPYLGARAVDEQGLALLARWIESMQPREARPGTEVLIQRARSLRGGTLPAVAEWKDLTATAPGALALRIAWSETNASQTWTGAALDRALEAKQPLIADLLSPRLPARLRKSVIGNDPDLKQLLGQRGHAERGRNLFFAEGGLQCFNCHIVEGRGRNVGPDLSEVGKKFTREELLHHIIHPSARIDPEFASWVADLRDGESATGFLVSQNADEVVLRDSTGVQQKFARSALRTLQKSDLSLMPEGLIENLTVEEAADLIEFLTSRRR